MAKAKSKNIIPISDTQAAIGAGAIMSFFVIWALIAGVGDDFVCWIGGKDNLSGWVQAVGSIVAIMSGVWTVRFQLSAQRKEAAERSALIERERMSRASQILLGKTAHAVAVSKNINKRLAMNNPRWSSLANSAANLCATINDIPASELPAASTAALLAVLQAPLLSLSEALQDSAAAEKVPDGGISQQSIRNIMRHAASVEETAVKLHDWLVGQAKLHMSEEENKEMRAALRIFL